MVTLPITDLAQVQFVGVTDGLPVVLPAEQRLVALARFRAGLPTEGLRAVTMDGLVRVGLAPTDVDWKATGVRLPKVWDHRAGQRARCRGCGCEVWWVVTEHGRRAPVEQDGISHFARCPKATDFRQKRGTGKGKG